MADKYSAAESNLGYFYQSRYALLRALQESKKRPSLSVSIEKFDDISFDDGNNPIELIQTKHHCTPGEISDFSVDVWKTLNIWIDRLVADPNQVAETRFLLLTTATAAPDCALTHLREHLDERDETLACSKLKAAASDSSNKATKSSREKFLSLTEAQQKLLVSVIWVFDCAPNIVDVRAQIEDLLHFSASGHASTLVTYLEGWWFDRIILALKGDMASSIPFNSIEKKVFEISDGFKFNGLPLDETIDSMPAPSTVGDDRTFIRQLGFVKISKATRDAAVRDFYRAYSQRSRWARENLLLDGEAEKYDRSLEEAWGHEYSALCEDTADADEFSKTSKGRELLRWANRYSRPFRGRDELWLSSGSFQMLADDVRIGWHPDFQTRLDDTQGE